MDLTEALLAKVNQLEADKKDLLLMIESATLVISKLADIFNSLGRKEEALQMLTLAGYYSKKLEAIPK
jgi:hypothetical protein